MNDPMVSRLSGELAALRREVAELRRRQPSGTGVSTAFGATNIRTTQLGFPAELTSAYDATTGYSWKALELDRTVPEVTDPAVQVTGEYAFTVDGNEGLTSGTRVWLEPDPNATGWLIDADCCGWRADYPTRYPDGAAMFGSTALWGLSGGSGAVTINLPFTRIEVPAGEAGTLFGVVGVNVGASSDAARNPPSRLRFDDPALLSPPVIPGGVSAEVSVRARVVKGPGFNTAPVGIAAGVRVLSGQFYWKKRTGGPGYGDIDQFFTGDVDALSSGGFPRVTYGGSYQVENWRLAGQAVWSCFIDNRAGAAFDVQWELRAAWQSGATFGMSLFWNLVLGVTMGSKRVGAYGLANAPTTLVWRKECCPDEYEPNFVPGPYPVGYPPPFVFFDPPTGGGPATGTGGRTPPPPQSLDLFPGVGMAPAVPGSDEV